MAATLEQRPFGNTGEKVTVIGLGGAFLYKQSFEQGVETVKHALELGVNYFDTSPAYGRMRDGKWITRGESQLIMGEGLDGSTKPHLLATKLHKCRSVEDFRAQIQENLHALRRDRVDVLQAHDIERAYLWKPDTHFWKPDNKSTDRLNLNEELDFENAPVIQAMREAKEQGLCRFVGISSQWSEMIVHVLKHAKLDMCLSAMEYSLCKRRSPHVVLPFTREQGIAYVVGGIFSATGAVGGAFSDERLLKLAETTGMSIATLTVRFLIANQEISTILVGASTPEEIEESVMAVQAGPLPSDLARSLEELGSNTGHYENVVG